MHSFGSNSVEAPPFGINAADTFVPTSPCASARGRNVLAATTVFLVFGNTSLSANEFCDGYADEAVAQTSEASLYPVCELTGPRWDTERDSHLAWCRELKGPPSLASLELALRQAALITCLMSVYGPPPAASVTKATDGDGTESKMDDESDHPEAGTEPAKP